MFCAPQLPPQSPSPRQKPNKTKQKTRRGERLLFSKEEELTSSVSTATIQITYLHSKVWGPHKEGSLQLLKIISSSQGGHCQWLWTSFSGYSYKAWKIISTTGPLPRSSYSWTHETLCPENECPGRSPGVIWAPAHINHPECGLMLGFTAKAASKVDSSEKGRRQNNIRSIKCPPFPWYGKLI